MPVTVSPRLRRTYRDTDNWVTEPEAYFAGHSLLDAEYVSIEVKSFLISLFAYRIQIIE